MPHRTPLLIALSTLAMTACTTAPVTSAPASPSLTVQVPAVAHPQGETPQWWYRSGASTAAANGAMTGKAKNVILFLGDGMSLTTVAAARVLEGQRKGGPGEENRLSWETFPATAFSKTYNTDSQVPDSAGTMTAITTGVKSHMGAIGVYAGSIHDCPDSLPKQALSWLELADSASMATGIISTARLTHATPAATFSHVPDRDWESDADMSVQDQRAGCRDIAQQLLGASRFGHGPQVILGGGRYNFFTREQTDPQNPKQHGKRRDGRDLVAEWKTQHPQGAYVYNTGQLRQAAQAPAVLGLFSRSHMDYDHDRDTSESGQPSLAEMTRAAIANLSRNPNGYVLMVEGARIDHANHAGNAFRALDETIAMSQAVQAAMDATSADDTLIVVTADHSHVLNFVGYPSRGNPILDKVRGKNSFDGQPGGYAKDLHHRPYTTLSYANGPGHIVDSEIQQADSGASANTSTHAKLHAVRPDLTQVNTMAPDYLQEALVPLADETHGGEDVGIWSRGPGSLAFRGSMEQNAIYHVIVQATPRLRERLCDAGTCDAQGIPVELPKPAAFEKVTR